jgi:hypothetical protein
MPSLAQATSKTVEELGLKRVATASPLVKSPMESTSDGGDQYTRCPVPPISISPDSLSSYEQKGAVPQARFMASLPLFQDTGSGAVNVTTTVVASGGSRSSSSSGSSGSSGSSSGTTASNSLPTNIGIVTPKINGNSPYTASVQMSPLFLLYKVAVSSPARVELYSTSSFQTLDVGRSASTPVTLGSENGIIGDFNLALSTESPWLCSPAPTGYNGDSPISSTIYVTITNLNSSTASITVTLYYLPLGES